MSLETQIKSNVTQIPKSKNVVISKINIVSNKFINKKKMWHIIPIIKELTVRFLKT